MIHTYGYLKLHDADENIQIKLAAKAKEKQSEAIGDRIKRHIKNLKPGHEEDEAAAKAVGSKLKRVGLYGRHVYGKALAGNIAGGLAGGALGTAVAGPAGTMIGGAYGSGLGSTLGSAHGIRSAVRKEDKLRNAARKSVRAKRLRNLGKGGAALAGLTAVGYAAKKHFAKKEDKNVS